MHDPRVSLARTKKPPSRRPSVTLNLMRLKLVTEHDDSSPAPSRPAVVVVDDDEGVLRSLRILLRRDYEVTLCNSSADAVEVIRQVQPDTVVLDIRMPEHDGFWVYNEVRKFNTDVPIIFNSAYQDAKDESEIAANYQAAHYLFKSGDVEAFRKALASTVGSYRKQTGR